MTTSRSKTKASLTPSKATSKKKPVVNTKEQKSISPLPTTEGVQQAHAPAPKEITDDTIEQLAIACGFEKQQRLWGPGYQVEHRQALIEFARRIREL